MKTGFLALAGLLLTGGSPVARAQSPLPSVNSKARQTYSEILMWHDVVSGKKDVWFDTTTAELKAQFEAIRRRKCHVITLESLRDNLLHGAPLPSRPVVLTFDDNNQGLYDNAFPLLKQFHYPATFFVHTGYVGVTTDKQHCTWDELRTLQGSGLVSVQGHSKMHPEDLRVLPEDKMHRELADSKAEMEKQMGRPVFAFAYPSGHYNDRVALEVVKYGYQIGITEDWGSAGQSKNLMELHRYSMHKRFAQALSDIARAYPAR